MPNKCAMCEEKDLKYVKSKLCESCYQFLYYWRKKSVTQVMERHHTLQRWSTRTEKLIPDRVSPIKRKPKPKPKPKAVATTKSKPRRKLTG